jgi:UPF0755 protein
VKRSQALLVVVLVVLVVLGGGGYVGYQHYDGDVHAHRRAGQPPVNITIPTGSSVSAVGDILAKNGIVGDPVVFQAYVRIHGFASKLEAGHYQVPGGADMAEVVALISHSRGSEVSVTIPEGYDSTQIGNLMGAKGLFSREAYLAAVQQGTVNQDFVAGRPAGAGLEGFLFPDTYFFAPKAAPFDVVTAQVARFGEVITPDLRAHAADHQLTLFQAVTLASIVEREAKFDEDRGQIAAVFYNRLAAGMPLEADATILYARGRTSGSITQADKAVNSPYNTYLNKGVPPGPICNPGRASIVAALTPPSNDFLYYLTDKDGHAHFSKTYAEHQAQAVQYGVQ